MTSDELLKNGGLFKIKIDLTGAFDEEDETQAETVELLKQSGGTSHYIILREINSAEMMEVQEMSQQEITRYLEKKIPECIVEHSFQTSAGGETSSGDVLKILRLSSSLMVYVLTQWQESLPLAKRMQKASAEQAHSSSEDAR